MIEIEIRIERDLSHNFMIPVTGKKYSEEDYQFHMLTENRILGLLDMKIRHLDGHQECCFDITSRISMEQLYENGYMKEEDILRIVRSLAKVVEDMGRFLLDENSILLEPSCIYLHEESGQPSFCYLPGFQGDIETAFGNLAEYILRHLDQTDPRAVLLGYEIYRQSSQKNYSLENVLKKAIDQKKEGKTVPGTAQELPSTVHEISEADEPAEPFGKSKKEDASYSGKKTRNKRVQRRSTKQKKTAKKKEKTGISGSTLLVYGIAISLFLVVVVLTWLKYLTPTQGGGISFLIVGIFGFVLSDNKENKKKKRTEETIQIYESDPDATRVLWDGEEEYQPQLSLIGMNSRDRITVILQKEEYLIGKQKSKVDVFINDPSVSRIHARIVKEEGDFYLSDMSSTNGTFHNGRRLEQGEKVKLELTDEVTFAESGFYIGNC